MAELRLALMLVQVEQLKAEKEQLALTAEVQLLESSLHPPRLVMPEQLPPPGPAMPEPEEPMPDPMQEIAQRIGLSLQPSLSPASES